MFKLVIQDDEGKTTVVPLIRDEITIGRKEGNTIRLTERNVSRKHAKISRANGAVAIEDLGSYNGVKVNGTRIMQKVTLNLSDRVQIGDYLIELKAEGTEQPAPAAYSDDARTQPIERLDAATLGNLGLPPPQPAAGLAPMPMAMAPAPAAAPAAATPARLVVLSSNFAGREFAITKSPTVIGRTDDNDVVINHRSISRNHAQITRNDAGRFAITDLQSANGVRVNGEDYSNVDLRRGDTIDLGHVRLRFVEPGEDFVFGRDAQVVDVPTGGGKKTWLWGVIGVGVIGAVIAVVVVGGGGGKGKGKEEVAVGATGSGGSAAAVAPGGGPGTDTQPSVPAAQQIDAAAVPDAPTTAVPPGPGSGAAPAVDTAGLDQALGAAKAAVAASDWATAKGKAQEALSIDPGNAAAKELVEQAGREAEAADHFKAFTSAATAKEYDKAVRAFEKIPTDSVYKNQARGTYDQLHDEFVQSRVNNAKQLARNKQCTDLKRLAIMSGNVFPDAREAMEKVPCQSDDKPGPGSTVGSGPGSSPPPPPSGKSAAELLDEAQAAASAGQYGRALNLAEQAYRFPGIDGGTKTRAATLAGLSACNTKQGGKAKTYYNLVPSRQTLLRQQCLKQGIDPAQ